MLQPAVRIGQLDPDPDSEADRLMHYDARVNHFVRGRQARLSAAASLFDAELGPSRTDVIFMVQASF